LCIYLRGAGKGNVALFAPGALALNEFDLVKLVGHLTDAAAAHELQVQDLGHHLVSKTIFDFDIALAVAQCEDLGALFDELLWRRGEEKGCFSAD
jgi:hypothetical protein